MPTMPNGTYQPAGLGFVDAGNEKCSVHLWGKVLTAANFDDQVALWATLSSKIAALVLGGVTRAFYANEVTHSPALPTNGAAREIALRVTYQDDTTGEEYQAYIPTLDPSIPDYVDNVSARDAIVMSTPTAVTDLIAAWEAFAVNPLHPANTITVIGLKVVRGGK